MFKRVITGALLVAVFVPLLIFSDTVVFTLAMTLLSLVGAYEMLRCLKLHKDIVIALPSLLIAAGAPLLARLVHDFALYAPWAISAVLIYLFWFLAYCVIKRGKIEYAHLSGLFMAIVYISAGFASLLLLRDAPGGAYVFWLVFIGAWVTDTMAYFTGFFFGKHKLIVEVSPKKTVEGAIGGTLFSGIAYVIYGIVLSHLCDVRVNLIVLFIAGITAAVVSQFGDLAASIIKRQSDIKDYGSLFPGHGGVLDRFDSIIALAPFILMMHSAPFMNLII